MKKINYEDHLHMVHTKITKLILFIKKKEYEKNFMEFTKQMRQLAKLGKINALSLQNTIKGNALLYRRMLVLYDFLNRYGDPISDKLSDSDILKYVSWSEEFLIKFRLILDKLVLENYAPIAM